MLPPEIGGLLAALDLAENELGLAAEAPHNPHVVEPIDLGGNQLNEGDEI